MLETDDAERKSMSKLELKGFLGQDNDQTTNQIFGIMETKAPLFISRPKQLETDYEKPIRSFFKDQKSTQEIDRYKIVTQTHSGDFQELDEKVKSLMGKSETQIANGGQRAKVCKVCGKEGAGIAIRDHIEANHLEGVSLPCNICRKTFKTRMMLGKHKCVDATC